MKHKQLIITLGLLIATFSLVFLAVPTNAKTTVSNSLPSQLEVSVPITEMNIYGSNYRSVDQYAGTNWIDVSPIRDLVLLKDATSLDLSTLTLESDNIPLGSTGVNLFDRPAYSSTFLNETYNVAVETNATATVTTAMAISSWGTTGSFAVTVDATNDDDNSAYQISDLQFDSNNDGDYADAADKAYLPLTGSEVFQIGVKTTFTGSDATNYGQIELILTMTDAVDHAIQIKMFSGSGNSGWSLVGGSADSLSLFSAYDSSGEFLALSIPLENIISDDSNEVGSILGLNQIKVTGFVSTRSEAVTMEFKNIALFSQIPALTDRVDNTNNWNYNDAGNVYAGVHDIDTDYFITKITEGATELYDSLLALNKDLSGVVTTLNTIRHVTFSGVASHQPATSSISVVSTKVGSYWLTTEKVVFDSQDIKLFDTFSNIFVVGDQNLNFTIDDSVLAYTQNYEDNLYQEVAGSGDFEKSLKVEDNFYGADLYSAFSASGVSGTSSPKTEVQYNIIDWDTTNGLVTDVIVKYFTKADKTGGVAVVASPNGNVIVDSPQAQANNDMFIIIAVVSGVVIFIIWKKR